MRLNEEEIRKIALSTIRQLGNNADPELVKEIVSESIEKMDDDGSRIKNIQYDSDKVILTSFGVNHPGIFAELTAELSKCNCNILDVSQKILNEYYTLIIVIDIADASCSLKELQDKMSLAADKQGVKVYLQHEAIFKSMHYV